MLSCVALHTQVYFIIIYYFLSFDEKVFFQNHQEFSSFSFQITFFLFLSLSLSSSRSNGLYTSTATIIAIVKLPGIVHNLCYTPFGQRHTLFAVFLLLLLRFDCLPLSDFHLKDNFQSKWCLLSVSCCTHSAHWTVEICFYPVWIGVKNNENYHQERKRERERSNMNCTFFEIGSLLLFLRKNFVSKLISTWFSSLLKAPNPAAILLLLLLFCCCNFSLGNFMRTLFILINRTHGTIYQLKNCPFLKHFRSMIVDVW